MEVFKRKKRSPYLCRGERRERLDTVLQLPSLPWCRGFERRRRKRRSHRFQFLSCSSLSSWVHTYHYRVSFLSFLSLSSKHPIIYSASSLHLSVSKLLEMHPRVLASQVTNIRKIHLPTKQNITPPHSAYNWHSLSVWKVPVHKGFIAWSIVPILSFFFLSLFCLIGLTLSAIKNVWPGHNSTFSDWIPKVSSCQLSRCVFPKVPRSQTWPFHRLLFWKVHNNLAKYI